MSDRWVDALSGLTRGDEIDVCELVGCDDPSPLKLAEYESEATRLVQAAQSLRAAIRAELSKRLGDSALRYGETVWRNQTTTEWRVLDARALGEWLAEDWQTAIRVDSGNLRRTGLKALAQARGQDPAVILDTFVEITRTDRHLEQTPLSKVPKRLQDLEEGECRV